MIKVCGMREPENIRDVVDLGVDLIGGIFYEKSPRFIGDRRDTQFAFSRLPDSVAIVGVFVNPTIEYLEEMKEKFKFKYIQLHGNESIEFCTAARKIAPLFKAFGIHDEFDFESIREYEQLMDMFIFDTSCKEHGGSGKKFNWDVLKNYQGNTPFLLSGGIGPDDVDAVKSVQHSALAGFDLNSGFETKPALKDVGLLKTFTSQF